MTDRRKIQGTDSDHALRGGEMQGFEKGRRGGLKKGSRSFWDDR